jgi:acetyl esterase
MSNLRDAASDIRNPELIELLREMDARGGMAPFTAEEKRSAYRKGIGRAGTPEPVASAVDRTIPGPAGEVGVRIYRPKLDDRLGLPVVLYLHGGGFISGDLDTHDPVCRMISNHVPAVVVAVDYRLAPEHPYPAAIEDCFAVLSWLEGNAYSIGGDPRRIAVVGDSAGGNLAAVLPLMARDKGAVKLAAQVLIYPMVDATLSSASLVENAFIPPFTLVDCVKAWQMYLAGNEDRREPYISPLRAPTLTGLPPALVITSEYDILADEGEAYAGRLREAGVRTEHEEFQGMIHGFFQWGGVVAAARLAMNRVVQFLQHATT